MVTLPLCFINIQVHISYVPVSHTHTHKYTRPPPHPNKGASLHMCMTPHGPDTATFEKEVSAVEDAPAHLPRDTMAFMFETSDTPRVTAAAIASPHIDRNYYKYVSGGGRGGCVLWVGALFVCCGKCATHPGACVGAPGAYEYLHASTYHVHAHIIITQVLDWVAFAL